MRYFRRPWNESRGDDYDGWGNSIWYLEVGPDGYPVRQIEVYENGSTLTYDQSHLDDQFGGLGDQAIELEEFSQFEIPRHEFEEAWKAAMPLNR